MRKGCYWGGKEHYGRVTCMRSHWIAVVPLSYCLTGRQRVSSIVSGFVWPAWISLRPTIAVRPASAFLLFLYARHRQRGGWRLRMSSSGSYEGDVRWSGKALLERRWASLGVVNAADGGFARPAPAPTKAMSIGAGKFCSNVVGLHRRRKHGGWRLRTCSGSHEGDTRWSTKVRLERRWASLGFVYGPMAASHVQLRLPQRRFPFD